MTIILRRWWLLIILPIIATTVGYLISIRQPSVYQATTTILIGQNIQSADVNRTDIQASEALALTYADLTVRQPILQNVIDKLNLGVSWRNLRNRIHAEPVTGTQLLEINVEANSPELARSIADEVANQLILLSPNNRTDSSDETLSAFNNQQIAYLQEKILSEQKKIDGLEAAIQNARSSEALADLQNQKMDLEKLIAEREQIYLGLVALANKDTMPNSLAVVEPAQASNYRIRPRVELNSILSGMLGLVLALGFILLLDYLDDTFNSMDELYQSVNLPVFGVVGKIQGKNITDKLITQLETFSPIAESFRMIRSKIGFKIGDSPKKAIAVISAMPGEGKSLTAANLAIVMAQAGLKTILVDADLRRSVVHQIFDVENEIGMADLLTSQKIKVNDCLTKTHIDNLRILTSGKRISDTTERLGTRRLSEVVTQLKNNSDVVIFDSPPALLVADTSLLCNQVDGVILVVRAGKSKRRWIQQTILDMEKADANLMGCIVNQPLHNGSFDSYKTYKYAS